MRVNSLYFYQIIILKHNFVINKCHSKIITVWLLLFDWNSTYFIFDLFNLKIDLCFDVLLNLLQLIEIWGKHFIKNFQLDLYTQYLHYVIKNGYIFFIFSKCEQNHSCELHDFHWKNSENDVSEKTSRKIMKLFCN